MATFVRLTDTINLSEGAISLSLCLSLTLSRSLCRACNLLHPPPSPSLLSDPEQFTLSSSVDK